MSGRGTYCQKRQLTCRIPALYSQYAYFQAVGLMLAKVSYQRLSRSLNHQHAPFKIPSMQAFASSYEPGYITLSYCKLPLAVTLSQEAERVRYWLGRKPVRRH